MNVIRTTVFFAVLFVTVDGLQGQLPPVDFARDIRPILNANCVACHGGVTAAAGVSFVYQDQVVKFEADSGEIVVSPGAPDRSELLARITTDDEDLRMPPADEHKRLTDHEIALIKRWISEGARWKSHWAFIPPRRAGQKNPKTGNPSLAIIDDLVKSRLDLEGLDLAPQEEPQRLLRRLYMGLIGLPPTPTECDAFAAAHKTDPTAAIENVVDELLSRESFGERWATMWLDLVRYADSGGLGVDQRRIIWPYRDWVVKAFNEDMPFDQFTLKQLAGDLLPRPSVSDFVATACHRNTQTNNEGGTDDEEFRIEAVIDRVNTTWQTWGSLTFGCTQCHDHPYEPIRHEEYYRFMAFFNDSADSDLHDDGPRLKVPNDSGHFQDVAAQRQHILELKQKIWKAGIELRDDSLWQGVLDLKAHSQNETKYAVEQLTNYAEFFTVGTVATQTQTHLHVPLNISPTERVTAIRLVVLPHNPTVSKSTPEWGFVITNLEAWLNSKDGQRTELKFRCSVPDVAWLPTHPLRPIEDNGKNWGANSRIHHQRQLVLVPSSPLAALPDTDLEIRIHCNQTGHGSHPMVIQRGHLATTTDPRWSSFLSEGTKLNDARKQISRLRAQWEKVPGTSIPIMQNRPQPFLRPTHVFVRGNPQSKGDQVAAGLPKSLTVFDSRKDPVAATNRYQMAKWWIADDNPLTARVFVNRIWAQLFGQGIVTTLEDFGSSGQKPTHPQLLDGLAVRFQHDYRWSIKSLVREIVLSQAYQQSATQTPQSVRLDPNNRWISRGPRLRLTAEMVRDQALAVSGLLSPAVGGPPVRPPIPAGVWQPFDAGDKWKTVEVGNPNRYRRSLYTYRKRSIPFPTFSTFDAPSREFCTPRRLTSNTPLQALVTLNDPAFVECAEAFGRRLKNEFEGTIEQRLAMGYKQTTGRNISPQRSQILRKMLVSLVNKPTESTAVSPDVEAAEQPDLIVALRDADWSILAQVLMNQDEALSY